MSIFRVLCILTSKRVLVEIDFLTLKQLFLALKEQNKQKNNGKKLILTSERRVEHPFAGRNTQQQGY